MVKKIINILLLCSMGLGCGKKIDNSGGSEGNGNLGPRDGDDISETLRRFINQQQHTCEDELHCNESIAKIIVVDRQNIKYCTGTLVEEDLLLTSSSCLPKSLQVPSLKCSQNIFVLFPGTTFLKLERVGCKNIVSSDTNDDVDPALWRTDFAFIKLDRKLERKVIKISKQGLKEDVPYRTFKIDYENDYLAYQKLSYCFPVFNTYANPFSENRFSPMISVRDCDYAIGNDGAPLFDFAGDLVGIFSGKLDKGVGAYVLNTDLVIEPIAPLHHVANTACLKRPDINTTDQNNADCDKVINTALLDKKRDLVLNDKNVHKRNFEDIRFEIESPVKYFKWRIDFFADAQERTYEPHFVKPKCFFDIKNWIYEFTRYGGRIREWTTIKVDVPNYLIQTKLDRKLKPVSVVTDKGVKSYFVSFNPRYAFTMNNTIVNIRADFQGNELRHSYQDVTDACPAFSE